MGPYARGFLLLPVTLTLVLVGALAYTMTREAGMGSASVDAEYDTERARYLAEAAFNLARWRENQQNCGKAASDTSSALYRYNLTNKRVGTTPADLVGTMTIKSTLVTNNSDNDKGKVTIDASGSTMTTPPASYPIEPRTVPRYDLGRDPDTARLFGNNHANANIFNGPNPIPKDDPFHLVLTDGGTNNQSYGLVQFNLDAVKDGLVKEATLRLKRLNGDESFVPFARRLDIYRVTHPWTPATTSWNTPWSKAGGDYAAEPVAGGLIATGSGADNRYYTWRIDTLVTGWVNSTIPNNGVLLKPSGLNGSHFSALTGGQADGPLLTVLYYPRCK